MNPRKLPGECERLDREIFSGESPSHDRQPAYTARQRGKRVYTVLVAVLGMNGFAGAEVEGLACYLHFLPLETGKMHFDAMTLAIVKGVMLESIEPECTAKLAVNSRQ